MALVRALALVLLLGVAAPASAEELTLSVAISMKDAIEELGRGFTQARPGVVLRHNLGASGELSKQIEAGGPAGPFLSAAARPKGRLWTKGLRAARWTRASCTRPTPRCVRGG